MSNTLYQINVKVEVHIIEILYRAGGFTKVDALHAHFFTFNPSVLGPVHI